MLKLLSHFLLGLWNYLEFFYKPGTGTPKGSHQNPGWGPSPLHFEYSPENKVYSFFWS